MPLLRDDPEFPTAIARADPGEAERSISVA